MVRFQSILHRRWSAEVVAAVASAVVAFAAVAVVVASSDPLLGLLRQTTRPQFLERKYTIV